MEDPVWIRDDWKGDGIWKPIADALSRLGRWCNDYQVTPPLIKRRNRSGVKLYWEPWESPFDHPFRVRPSATTASKIDISGGLVYNGAGVISVSALTGVQAEDDRKISLKVHYHNDSTADTAALESTTGAWPSDSYTVDTLPDATPTTLPDSGHCTFYIRIAEIDGLALKQYQYDNVWLPKGGTYTITHSLGTYWDGATLKEIKVVQTMVNGVSLRITSSPTVTSVLSYTDECP